MFYLKIKIPLIFFTEENHKTKKEVIKIDKLKTYKSFFEFIFS